MNIYKYIFFIFTFAHSYSSKEKYSTPNSYREDIIIYFAIPRQIFFLLLLNFQQFLS